MWGCQGNHSSNEASPERTSLIAKATVDLPIPLLSLPLAILCGESKAMPETWLSVPLHAGFLQVLWLSTPVDGKVLLLQHFVSQCPVYCLVCGPHLETELDL